jgi:hypothetical protein
MQNRGNSKKIHLDALRVFAFQMVMPRNNIASPNIRAAGKLQPIPAIPCWR